ncbi:hypothetical protein QUF70_08075 [Desulfobacterales bacterium HSG17]|nr:hypothetical protein [Desulfobacterales bacterium HSG17]
MNREKKNSENKPENKMDRQGWLQKLLAWLANGVKKADKDMASCLK